MDNPRTNRLMVIMDILEDVIYESNGEPLRRAELLVFAQRIVEGERPRSERCS